MKDSDSPLNKHADTLAIIGVNLAVFALVLQLVLSNSHKIDVQSARTDAMQMMIYDLLKEMKK